MACNTCIVQDPAILPAAHQSYEREQTSVLQPRVVPDPIAQKFEVTNAPEHTTHTENARTVGSHTHGKYNFRSEAAKAWRKLKLGYGA